MSTQPDFLQQGPERFLESSPSAFLNQSPEDFLAQGLAPPEPRVADDPKLAKIAIAIAAAVVALRFLMKAALQKEQPKSPEEIRESARRIYDKVLPAWVKIAAPAFAQAYRLGATDTMTYAELEKMAEDYVQELGEYIHESSISAVADGFSAQINAGWSERLAWVRASEGYGLDGGQMRSYVKGLMTPGDNGYNTGNILPDTARATVDQAFIVRADRLGREEAFTATQVGRNVVWLSLQASGQLPDGTMKRWVTAEDERVCPVCAPLDGVAIPLHRRFESAGRFFYAPSVHPNCRCEIVLVYPETGIDVVKALGSDPFDRDSRGRFASYEQRINRGYYDDDDDDEPESSNTGAAKLTSPVEFTRLTGQASLSRPPAELTRPPAEFTREEAKFSEADRKAVFTHRAGAEGFAQASKPYDLETTSPDEHPSPPIQPYYAVASLDANFGAVTFLGDKPPRLPSEVAIGSRFIVGKDDPAQVGYTPVFSSSAELEAPWKPVSDDGVVVPPAVVAAFENWIRVYGTSAREYYNEELEFTKRQFVNPESFGEEYGPDEPEIYRHRLILSGMGRSDLMQVWRDIVTATEDGVPYLPVMPQEPATADSIALQILRASEDENAEFYQYYRLHGGPPPVKFAPIRHVLENLPRAEEIPAFEESMTGDELEDWERRAEDQYERNVTEALAEAGAVVTPTLIVFQGWYGNRRDAKSRIPIGDALGEYEVVGYDMYDELPEALQTDLTDQMVKGLRIITVKPV